MGQQYNVGEKPTVITMYIYINRHAGPPKKTKQKTKKGRGSNNIQYTILVPSNHTAVGD